MPRGDKSKYKQECKADHIAGSYESLESRKLNRGGSGRLLIGTMGRQKIRVRTG
jgi:hypothetical protein